MEVFVRDVDYFASSHDVNRAIARVLHPDPNYSPSVPLNFHVRLFKDRSRNRRQHKGCGALTLPSATTGNLFLREYGGKISSKGISVGSRKLLFQLSRNQASADVLEKIRNSPYLDPAVAEKRERLAASLNRTTMEVRQIQFGWDCRDHVFSIEWEHVPRTPAQLSFDYNARGMTIKIFRSEGYGAPSQMKWDSISVNYSQIGSVSETLEESTQSAIFISFISPPSFQTSEIVPALPPLEDTIQGQRLSCLPLLDSHTSRPHAEVAPYVSYSLRLMCSRRSSSFAQLAETAELNVEVDNNYYPAVRRGLFSRETLGSFNEWMRTVDFYAAFQLEALVRDLKVDPSEMLELRQEVAGIARATTQRGSDYLTRIFRDFGAEARDLYYHPGEHRSLKQCLLDAKDRYDKQGALSDLLSKRYDEGLFMCFHVLISPTGVYFEGPQPERSNRVIRSFPPRYHRCFIRVSFVDEGRLKLRFDRSVDAESFVRERVGSILSNGLTVAGRKFRYLAYSQSSLKEHSVWFLRSFRMNEQTIDVETIINSIGSFSDLPSDPRLMLCPARYAARISQAFTTTDPTTTTVEHIRTDLQDIETVDPATGKKWPHTDGVGTMSPAFARSICAERQKQKKGRHRRLKDYPRALQIRFMGSKGMLSVDYTLKGKTVCLRPSMIKFAGAQSNRIEIAKVFDKPGQFYLNRPLIMVLEGLGVPYESFKKHQDEAVREAYLAKSSLSRAAGFFEGHGLGASFRLSSVLLNLVKLGATLPAEGSFYGKLLEYAINHVLRLIKHKARIPVPGAYNLVGVADVHGYLRPRQVFVCINKFDGSPPTYLEGKVIVSRSPVIHPGDVQIAHAIGSPPKGSCFEFEPLANTIVFNTTDHRPLASCLGGGDLDGDEYNVIPLEALPEFTPEKCYAPSQYEPAPRKELDRPCNQQDVVNFIVEYITSDVLGYVSIEWRLIADLEDAGIFHPKCLKLANLHSLAVDYPKSGQRVPVEEIPKRTDKRNATTILPDWYAPETVEGGQEPSSLPRYYPSKRAIGKLFRAVELPATAPGQRAAARGRLQQEKYYRERDNLEDDVDNLASLMEDLGIDGHVRDEHWKAWGSRRRDPHSICAVVQDRVSEFVDVSGATAHGVHADHIKNLFIQYRSELQAICSTYALSQRRSAMLTEEEAVVGTIVANTSQPRRRLDYIAKVREQTAILVQGVRRSLAIDNSDDDDSDEADDEEEYMENLRRAYFAWNLSLAHAKDEVFGAQSFGWIALGGTFEAIKDIEGVREFRIRGGRYE